MKWILQFLMLCTHAHSIKRLVVCCSSGCWSSVVLPQLLPLHESGCCLQLPHKVQMSPINVLLTHLLLCMLHGLQKVLAPEGYHAKAELMMHAGLRFAIQRTAC